VVIQIHDGFVGLSQQLARLIRGGAQRSLLLAASAALLCQCGAPAGGVHQEVTREGQFAQLRLFQPPGPVRHLLLVRRWRLGPGPRCHRAQRLALGGTAVAGIEVREWLEALERAASTRVSPGRLSGAAPALAAGAVRAPRAAGARRHSAGATLAYVALAQGRAQDFRGAVTLSFCVDLDLAKPPCAAPALRATRRSAGVRLAPGGALPVPGIGLHGLDDRDCPAPAGRAFVEAVPGARFVPLPGEGHSYGDIDSWWAPFSAAYEALEQPRPAGDPGP
jgi:hypothetical protein